MSTEFLCITFLNLQLFHLQLTKQGPKAGLNICLTLPCMASQLPPIITSLKLFSLKEESSVPAMSLPCVSLSHLSLLMRVFMFWSLFTPHKSGDSVPLTSHPWVLQHAWHRVGARKQMHKLFNSWKKSSQMPSGQCILCLFLSCYLQCTGDILGSELWLFFSLKKSHGV
jgi:hypothetical protein